MELPALPQSPVSTTHGIAQEHTSVEEPQRTVTPVPTIQPEEISPNQGGNQEEPPLPGSLEMSYQVPVELIQDAITPDAVELPQSYVESSTAVDEPTIPEASGTAQAPIPQDSARSESGAVTEDKTPEYESIPMQSSLSEGSKRKSKKARQREKKRRSLQGIDISGTAAAEMIRTPSIAEEATGVSTVTTPSLPESDSLPVTTTYADEPAVPVVDVENIAEVDARNSERMETDENSNIDLAQ